MHASKRSATPCLLALLLAAPALRAQYAPMPSDMSMDIGSVARLTDAEASCEQLYAEAGDIAERIEAMPRPEDPGELAMRMQADMQEAQKKMMASQRAKSVGSSLLAMVPGVGGIAAGSMLGGRGASMDGFNKAMEKGMKEQQANMAAAMAVGRLQARQGYVTNLFVERGCKPSQLDRGIVAAEKAALAAGKPPAPGISMEASAAELQAGDARAPDPGTADPAQQPPGSVVRDPQAPAGDPAG